MYEFTCQLASLEPPPPEMQQLLGAIQGNQSHKRFCAHERRDYFTSRVPVAGKHRHDHGRRASAVLKRHYV